MMSNDTNRLTDYDRNIICRAVTGVVACWSGPRNATDVLALERIARHSIGCTEAELRESELDEIAAIVARLVNSAEEAK
jgi:hypothetical protein